MRTKRQVFRLRAERGGEWKLVDSRGVVRTRMQPKKDAIRIAAQLVKIYAPSQLIVHKRDGRIEFERTYGADPRRSKG